MSDEPGNLVLRYLRRIDHKQDRLGEMMEDVYHRLGRLERTVAEVGVVLAEHPVRLDRADKRIGWLERRSDLVEEGPR